MPESTRALSEQDLRDAVRAAGIDVPPSFHEVTGSTNADALELARAGAPEWTVVAAGFQEAGRGRLGRTWSSPPGTSILLSVLLRPALPPGSAPLLSLLVSRAMADACAAAAGVAARLKWPNDLVVGERKLAGVLPESTVAAGRLEHVVVGVGLNVAQRPEDFPPEVGESATSLALEGGGGDQPAIVEAFLRAAREAYRPAEAGFAETVVAAARERSATLGRRVRAVTVDGRRVEGVAADLGPDGALLIDADGRREAVGFGEVAHLE
ncbi:MAG TPA: biotin--[acetyl-CoA-carboxylase] ligase [Actinomycetota bacterium]|nr:biotin--[acetyl-CoA-carboxylase] ligase [Actinomycetota bacterium]